jgi:Na+/melibiose symporter-like transporter
VFFGEVALVVVILALTKKVVDAPVEPGHRIDLVGTLLSIVGLGTAVFGVLRSSTWGWVTPKPDAPQLFGISATFWCIVAGSIVVWAFFRWENHLVDRGKEPLVRPDLLRNVQLRGGLLMFFFQFLLQAGVFFVVPLFLSVVLGLTAMQTGARVMPLSIALLVAAAGIPKLWPGASPRRVVRAGIGFMLAGILALIGGIDPEASAEIVSVPLMLIGLGIGALSSQLGAVTVSAVPDEDSPEVGGLQNTGTNLGASLGTALAGSVMLGVLTATLIGGISSNDAVPASVQQQATTELAAGVPFVSDAQLEEALDDAGVEGAAADAIVEENADARLEALEVSLAVLAVLAVVALFATGRIPDRPVGSTDGAADDPEVEPAPT